MDQQLQDFYAAHPDHEAHVKVVTGEDFKACYCEIKPLLNLDSLSGYLLKYGIASGYADMEALTSPYFKLQDRLNSFVRLVEEAGDRGFKLLYVCLVESADDAVGHVDVLRKLNNAGTYTYEKYKYKYYNWDNNNYICTGPKAKDIKY